MEFAVLSFNTLRITQMPFVTGAYIRTNHGDVPVERLRLGDRVVTGSGQLRPIVWIGHRRIDMTDRPDLAAMRPVLISAGAFGEGLPYRDLCLSPGQCVALAGALIPIARLINGRSVIEPAPDGWEYWAIELDRHDILLVEGARAESYLDCDDKAGFVGEIFVEPDPKVRDRYWADTCLPFAVEGAHVTFAKSQLLAHLADQGYAVVNDPDPHVLADGRRIDPIQLAEKRLAFALPADAAEITLMSKVFVPMQTRADSADARELGVCIGHMEIDGDPIALDSDELDASGWQPAELDNGHFYRWTRGAAPLRAGTRIIIIEIAGEGYYWRDPVDNVVTLSDWVGKRDGARQGEPSGEP
jgi:Hint domain